MDEGVRRTTANGYIISHPFVIIISHKIKGTGVGQDDVDGFSLMD